MEYKKWVEKLKVALIWEYYSWYQIGSQEDYNKSEYIKFVKNLDISDAEKLKLYKSLW